MVRIWWVSLCLGCCVVGPVAANEETLAEDSADNWLLAKYDTNGDKVISAEEIGEKRQRVFSQMDADADGLVSLTEYAEMDVRKRENILRARFSKLDIDRDGQISADEYRSYMGSFARLDLDGDRQVTAAEIDRPETTSPAASQAHTKCRLWLCVRSSLEP